VVYVERERNWRPEVDKWFLLKRLLTESSWLEEITEVVDGVYLEMQSLPGEAECREQESISARMRKASSPPRKPFFMFKDLWGLTRE
jgi:hypothetical protein